MMSSEDKNLHVPEQKALNSFSISAPIELMCIKVFQISKI